MRLFKKSTKYVILAVIFLIFSFPFLWLLSTSLKGTEEVFAFPPKLLPSQPNVNNYLEVWKAAPFEKYFLNSIIISIISTLTNLIIASLSGFALAKLHFKFKGIFFLMVLSAMFLPREASVIPLYVITLNLGMADTLLGASLPVAVEAFSILMMRNAFLSIPDEIQEAAIVDGCGLFKLFYKIMLPMTFPTLTTICIFSFIGAWGDFLWPIIVLKSQENYTLQVGLSYMLGTFAGNFKYVAAGSILALIPVIAIFIFFQKYFEQGLFAGIGK